MITLFRNLYLFLAATVDSYFLALLLLSAFTSALLFFFNWLFRIYPQREAHVQELLAPQLQDIRKNYRGAQAQIKQRQLYQRYRYHPLLALRSALPLFFQLPFLFAAYHALKGLPAIDGISFWLFQNLGQPDALILGYNVLPFVMTGINLLTACINPVFKFKEKVQAAFIALFFLILLYKAPAALLIYWTTNNLIFLLRTVLQRFTRKNKLREKDPTSAKIKEEFPAFNLAVIVPFLILIILSNLFEFIADGEGLFFYRFSKTVPLLMASLALYYQLLIAGSFPFKKAGKTLGILPFVLLAIAHLSGLYLIPTNRFVIFAYLSGLYLGLCAGLAIWQLFFKAKAESSAVGESTPRPVWNLLIYTLCLLIPSLHLAAANPMYLSGWFYPLFLILPLLIFAIAWLLLKAISSLWTAVKSPYHSLYALAFAMLFTYLPVFRAMLHKNSAHDGDFWLILLAVMSVIYLVKHYGSKSWNQIGKSAKATASLSEAPSQQQKAAFKPYVILYTVLAVFFIFALGNFITSILKGERVSKRKLQEIPALLQDLEFKDQPNIYLFVYDGVPNPRVFREQNLPLKPLQELFDKYAYKLYEDTYTLGNESLNSMAMTLNISAEQYSSEAKMQDIYSGNSLINLLLTQHGYSSYHLLENYYTGAYALANADLVTEYFPPKELSNVQSDSYLTILRGVLQGEFSFDIKGIMASGRYTETDRQERKQELIKAGHSPKFVIDHLSIPSHSQNSGKCLPNETELWTKRYLQSLEYLKRDLAALQEYDPNAIAIFIGDHGPSLLGDCYVLQNWKREDITPELIWDRLGTMIAIHWPDPELAAKYDKNLTLNQDIFAVILAYLADNPKPLELCPDRTFSGYGLLTRPAVKFRQGKMVN
ncbi:MAG: YidC/Oxa1 family membrane protein insertase [Candidatus Cloacimonetes bacterium]|nr:YidC/Oxa1 family membrane protein insertase [Candidatus Cloacimonadota bacterium]MDY0173368.1 YidC/Oxa1 family membrane protein insertase [Candidatus Cloacimonadaceae bacterium]